MSKITISAHVGGDREKVWEYYTNPTHITQWNFADPSWQCPSASNDLRIGGQYVARMEAKDGSGGFDFEATYTELVQGERFAYEFGGRYALVTFQVDENGTLVTVTFDPETENDPELQRRGWQSILNNFKKYVENN